MNYENLFRPGYIGGLRIKNRVVMTAMGNGLAAENGEASDEIIACYKARAAGGCGLLITEFCAVDGENGIAETHQLQIHAPRFIKRLALLTDTLHRYDCKVFFQLFHPGREQRPCTGFHGGAGREDIVDQQHPPEILRDRPRVKGRHQIFQTFRRIEFLRCGGFFTPVECRFVDREAELYAHDLGEHGCLVVATLPLSARVNGHRYDGVDLHAAKLIALTAYGLPPVVVEELAGTGILDTADGARRDVVIADEGDASLK